LRFLFLASPWLRRSGGRSEYHRAADYRFCAVGSLEVQYAPAVADQRALSARVEPCGIRPHAQRWVHREGSPLTTQPAAIDACPQCGTQLASTMKACPRCARLVHADLLESLAKFATEAAGRGEISSALSAWREALDLLPAASKQHQLISARITELGQRLPSRAFPVREAPRKGHSWQVATGLGRSA